MATWRDLARQIGALTKLAERDVRLLVLELDDFAERRVALKDVMPMLVDTYGQAAATVAAEWYDEMALEHARGGRSFSAIAAELPANTGADVLVDWAATEARTPASMLELALGGMQRRIANMSRATVIGSAASDPRSDGWMRVGDGDNCPFCDMLISRGAVYAKDTVRFGAHDHCNCQAAPSFGSPADIFDVDKYKRSQRRRDDETRSKDNERARQWIEENLSAEPTA
ncbi:VG15 protein [Aeromicrobium sp. HA]|uniref:VG15 protein n=1 Tax=Aeromicrobium sp. HA TaxID=3009077 RepID=UPI0022AE8BF8|nr:hypothetical protein [Aeromicrobium sp. HA]